MRRPPFPFVVGVARSGTTLLRLMLDRHPELAIPPESYFPLALLRRRRRFTTPRGVDLGALVEVLLSDRSWSLRQLRETWGIDPGVLRTRVFGTAPSYAEAIRALYRLYADLHAKPRYGDKTPTFITEMPLLSRLFPDASFVHVVRDGRDVAASLLEMRFGPRNVEDAAALWAEQVRLARRDRARVSYLEVRYERLVTDPRTVLEEVCAFLELSWEPRMLRFHEHAAARLAGESVPPENVRGLARPLSAGLRDWRRDMRRTDIARFEAVAGDALRQLGYEIASGDRAPSRRARLVRARAASALRARRILRRALAAGAAG